MNYYAERKNMLDKDFSLSLVDLKKYFYQTYKYFDDKGFFTVAFYGVTKEERYHGSYQVLAPTMSPSPEIFFINHLNSTDILPILDNYEYYKEAELFTIIEILYDHIGYYDFEKDQVIMEEPKNEFATHINNLLKRYDNGYYLDEKHGFIMEQPNEALKEMMHSEVPVSMAENVYEQLTTATKMYYRFDSNLEQKKKAINILADILEPIRNELKDLLNDEFNIHKNDHDKLIFGVVNTFQIRHDNDKQFKEYSKPIWYDWMMHYYSSVILTYYRLIQKSQDKIS
ncbi:hypothetical protein [Paenibacillus sp. FSL W7-1332]|uniref:hypothetical protein n=1 Tax=Paenibacillus sp. FSL W7-1332 TaxID=2921702 RepID=UPI0030D349E1